MKKTAFILLSLVLLIGCSKEENVVISEELQQNNPPAPFNLITPVQGEEVDVHNITFTWQQAVDPENDNISYDLYVYDAESSPVLLASKLTETSYTLEERYTFNSTVNWYVVAKDGKERGETTTAERNFTTRDIQAQQVLGSDTVASYPYRTTYTSLYFNNTFFIINGYGDASYRGDVWTSRNYGKTWLLENNLTGTGFERSGHSSVIFDDKMWVIGGHYNDVPLKEVYSSIDGTIWNEASFKDTFTSRYDHTSVVFNNKIWVIGGYGDGEFVDNIASWTGNPDDAWITEATAAQTPFNGLRAHSSVVYDNQIWVIGGLNQQGYQDNVWVTSDGMTWKTGVPFPQGFAHHKSVVFDDKIWVVGGATATGTLNDVFYYSKDTGVWKRYDMPEAFSERQGHCVVVIDEGTPEDGIYIFGGQNSNDVWKLY